MDLGSSNDVVLVVENLPQTVNNQFLRSIFKPFGARKCRVVYRKTQFMGLAGVTFPTLEQAKRALDRLNKTQIRGQEVTCRLAAEKDHHWFKKPKRKNKSKNKLEKQMLKESSKLLALLGNSGITGSETTTPPSSPLFTDYDRAPSPSISDCPSPTGSPLWTCTSPLLEFPSQQPSSPVFEIPKPVTIVNPTALRNQLALNSLNLKISKEYRSPFPLDHIKDLLNYDFVVISCGHTIGSHSSPLPSEIAIQVFSLASGISRSFHRFIDLSPLPSCLIPESQYFSQYKHGIPYSNFALAEQDMGTLWEDIKAFLSFSNTTPLLWGKGPDTLRRCMDYIATRAGTQNYFQVRAVEEISATISTRGNANIASSALGDYFSVHTTEPCTYHSQQAPHFRCALADTRNIVHTLSELTFSTGLCELRANS